MNLTLAPNYLSNATTATGSVADKTHPNVNAWYQVNYASEYAKTTLKQVPIKIAPHNTPGPAKTNILTIDFLKTCQSQLNAIK